MSASNHAAREGRKVELFPLPQQSVSGLPAHLSFPLGPVPTSFSPSSCGQRRWQAPVQDLCGIVRDVHEVDAQFWWYDTHNRQHPFWYVEKGAFFFFIAGPFLSLAQAPLRVEASAMCLTLHVSCTLPKRCSRGRGRRLSSCFLGNVCGCGYDGTTKASFHSRLRTDVYTSMEARERREGLEQCPSDDLM